MAENFLLPNGAVASGDKYVDEQMMKFPAELFARNRREFAAKLTVRQRMQIKAYHLGGVPITLLAFYFGISDRTAFHIVNDASLKYRSIANEVRELGIPAFRAKYLEDDLTQKIVEAGRSEEYQKIAGMKKSADRDRHRADASMSPNRRASSAAGMHVLYSGTSSRIVHIAWYESLPYTINGEQKDYGPGWYYTMKGGPMGDIDEPASTSDENNNDHFTSKKALEGVMRDFVLTPHPTKE